MRARDSTCRVISSHKKRTLVTFSQCTPVKMSPKNIVRHKSAELIHVTACTKCCIYPGLGITKTRGGGGLNMRE
jgi:hypothetical protein